MRVRILLLFVLVASGLMTDRATATKDDTSLASWGTGIGPAANDDSAGQSMSADGRWIVFTSEASNLSPEADGSHSQIFARDLIAGTTTLVSRATGGTGAVGDGWSTGPMISANGRYVAFVSGATNLDPSAEASVSDIFVRDLVLQTTTLVSRADGATGAGGDGSSHRPSISSDGRYVSFESRADNLDADSNDAVSDVYVRDLVANTTALVSRAAGGAGSNGAPGDGDSQQPSISSDGRYVSFESLATNLDADSDDAVRDVFVRDTVTGATTLVSRATGAAGVAGDAESKEAAMSADGRFVAFTSLASNLDPDATDGVTSIFVRDLVAGSTALVSRSTGIPGAPSSWYSDSPAISSDGRSVAFVSGAGDLTPDDSTYYDVFVRDTIAGTTTFVSRATGATGAVSGYHSYTPAISGNGRYVAFDTMATNLDGDSTDSANDVFVRDLLTSSTSLVSRGNPTPDPVADDGSAVGSISADGRYVVFSSWASNLDPDSDDAIQDIFVRDLVAGTTMLVSRATGVNGAIADGHSASPRISDDGRYVAFNSAATTLDPSADDDYAHVFVRDLVANTTTLVSRASGAAGAAANERATGADISADGRFVAFESGATNLDANATTAVVNVFIRDLETNSTTLVSRESGMVLGGPIGPQGDNASSAPSVSADGRYVAFTSRAKNFTDDSDPDVSSEVFIRDRELNTTTLVSRANGVAGVAGDDRSLEPSISGDGQFVAFVSHADNLDGASNDSVSDIFVRDVANARTTLVSRASGLSGAASDAASYGASISSDGRFVAFESGATALDLGSNDSVQDVFVRDVSLATTTLVSRASGTTGPAGDEDSHIPAISATGRYVAFSSWADNLDPDSKDGSIDTFVRDVFGPEMPVGLSINDVLREEGPRTSTQQFRFAISLVGNTDRTVTVDVSTYDVTANARSDYARTTQTVTFAPGEHTKVFTVVVYGDNANERDETFGVRLSNVSGAQVIDEAGTGTIFNDDGRPTPGTK